MKKRILQFLTTYFLFVLLFVLQKPIFMAYYHELYTDASIGDYFSVMWHGLPLDFSLAGYLTAIPGFLLIASAWTKSSILRRIRQGYFGIIAFVMSWHLHRRFGLIRFLGIQVGCHSDLLFLLISERCHGKRQLLVHITRNPCYADLCSHPLRYFLRRTHPGESTVEDTLSAAVCISRPFIADSCALHSYPWRFFRIDNEPEQSIL